MNGFVTTRCEFLFPDTPLGAMPHALHAACAKNGMIGMQALFACDAPLGCVEIDCPGFDAECFELVSVPVEYNTGNGIDQGGAMVILPETKPDYAVRKAPFDVYDCLRPLEGGAVPSRAGRCAVYIRLAPRKETAPGRHDLCITLHAGSEAHTVQLDAAVYPVIFDEDRFEQTNWFSVVQMEKMHGVARRTKAFEDVVRAYARSMRSVHQKIFLLWMHEDLSERRVKKPWTFDFEDMKPIIEIFFEEGFDTFETGGVVCRGYREDGSHDMYTADFKCAADPTVPVDSPEGRALLDCEMRAFASFLKKYGWENRVLFHVMDEPDVHCRSEADLEKRHHQFRIAADIVRHHLPGVKIIEAVKTTRFADCIDIMVPITDGYQQNKAAFDAAIARGESVWTYVCCAPTGNWLNRFLDQPLANGRLLFWGCAANRLGGYLHWGYNQFAGVPDPFKATSSVNWTGIGTNFPCGDAFIVYPDACGPTPSMRLEAERAGAEDAALLDLLRERDPAAHDALIAQVFRAFDDYDNDPEKLDRAHEELLRLLA